MEERIKRIISHYCGGSQAAFASAVGITPQYANRIASGHGCGLRTVEAILTAFPDVNARWLICGTGAMSINDSIEGECLADSIDRWFAANKNKREEVRKNCMNEIDTQWTPEYQMKIFKKHLK